MKGHGDLIGGTGRIEAAGHWRYARSKFEWILWCTRVHPPEKASKWPRQWRCTISADIRDKSFYGALSFFSSVSFSSRCVRGKNGGRFNAIRNGRVTREEVEEKREMATTRAHRPIAPVIVRRSLFARTLCRDIAILRKFDRFCADDGGWCLP